MPGNEYIFAVGMMSLNGVFNLLGRACTYVAESWDEIMYYRITINTADNPRLKRAIFEEIKAHGLHLNRPTIEMSDGFDGPVTEVSNGCYYYRNVSIEILDNKAILRLAWAKVDIFADLGNPLHQRRAVANGTDYLRSLVVEMYSRHNAATRIMMFFTSDGDKWGNAICREPRNFANLRITPSMQAVLDDFSWFNSSEGRQTYNDEAHPYRRGYFLYGAPGTGKTTIAEILAYRYERTVYMVTFDAKNMTNTKLTNLIGKVPPNAIILIDEIDKQLDSIRNNPTVSMNFGGLLSAIDGPTRLSLGTIVILTSNRKDILPADQQVMLLRPGRIDRSFELH